MKVQKSEYSPSFKMAWAKASKETLSAAIAKLSAKKQQVAIGIVNELEHNSPYHTLSLSNTSFCAVRESRSASNLFFDNNNNFFSSLKKFKNLILRQNIVVPQIADLAQGFEKHLAKYHHDRIFSSGVRIPSGDLPYVSADLAKSLYRAGKKTTIDTVLKLIKSINSKAKKSQVTVNLNISGVNLYFTKGFDAEKSLIKVKKSSNFIKTLKRIDKKLDKVLKQVEKQQAIKDKDFQKLYDEVEMLENRKKIYQKLKNTKIFQIFEGIKKRIVDFVDGIKQKREQVLKVRQEEVQKSLDI